LALSAPSAAQKNPKGKLIAIAAAAAVLALALFAVLSNIGRKDVYVAGSKRNAQGNGVATLWKNGAAQRLSDGGSYAEAVSVFVSGKDVYVAGYDKDVYSAETGIGAGKGVAMLWKNGVAQRLGEVGSKAKSVFVSGNDVYVAGWETTAQGKHVATLWINGMARHLSGGSGGNFKAESVFVSGGDVYVAGSEINSQGNGIATLWVNDRARRLSNNSKSRAPSVFVSGQDVYVAGFESNETNESHVATLWVNGRAQTLSDGGSRLAWASSVFVSGGDVYVAGYEFNAQWNAVAMLWKNGEAQRLGDGETSSIFVK
jgi:hypothetical protein